MQIIKKQQEFITPAVCLICNEITTFILNYLNNKLFLFTFFLIHHFPIDRECAFFVVIQIFSFFVDIF